MEKDRQMNEVLEESERRFHNLMEVLLVGICIIRRNRIVYQNSTLKKLLGSLPESFENDFFDHLHPDDVEKCKDMYRQITSGRRRTAEADFRFYPSEIKGHKVTPCWVQCRIGPTIHQGKKQSAKRIRIDSYCKNKCLCIQVSDSGPGIPKELADKVFDPFFTTYNDGSGIGLSIAQRIVTDHNGTIEILRSKWGGPL